MGKRFNDMAFLAVLVTAVILIFAAGVDPSAVKVVTDLVVGYWAVRTAHDRRLDTDEIER